MGGGVVISLILLSLLFSPSPLFSSFIIIISKSSSPLELEILILLSNNLFNYNSPVSVIPFPAAFVLKKTFE